MDASTPTRERILDAAMTLFSQRGFRGTSITAIETAAGLSPGAGGIYHHFATKETLLAAGVERHLARMQALGDIRALLTGLGDLRAELTLTARYALAELDRETELLQVLATEARAHPDLLSQATDQLVASTFTGFAHWLADNAGLSAERAQAVSAVGLGALLSTRLLHVLGLHTTGGVDDETFVRTWVQMMLATIEASPA